MRYFRQGLKIGGTSLNEGANQVITVRIRRSSDQGIRVHFSPKATGKMAVKTVSMKFNNYSQFKTRGRNLCAVVAISIALPALAYAKDNQGDKGKGDKGNKADKSEKGGKGDPKVSSVPEASTVWVLLPFIGAVLLFSARHLVPRKATE